MTATCDVSQPNASQSRYAAEWGLASLLMGCTLSVLAGITLLLNLQMFLSGPVWALEDIERLKMAAKLGAGILISLSTISLLMGIGGVVAAFRRCQPCPLGLAGILMSLSAITLWAFATINLSEVADVMMIRQGAAGLF